MKLCLVCQHVGVDADATCVKCGEASWAQSGQILHMAPKLAVVEPETTPATPESFSSRRKRGGK